MRASSDARARVISPSWSMPVSASASALRPVRAESQPTSSQPTSGVSAERVGREEHLLRGELEPAADRPREVTRIAKEGLGGEIRVHVRLAEKRRRLIGERPAAVDEHERRLPERRVVEHGLEQQRVAAGDPVVAADARAGMDVDGDAEPAGLARDVVEEKILERLVLGDRGTPPRVRARRPSPPRLRPVRPKSSVRRYGDLEFVGERAAFFCRSRSASRPPRDTRRASPE